MTHFSRHDLHSLEKIYRLNLVNSITGYKPANLIGTVSQSGHTNLAIFTSVVHLGSNPPLLGFLVRPATVERHTLENIRETGSFTINHVHIGFIENAHQTSAKYPKGISEFDACVLNPEYLDGFTAPYVKESKLKIGMQFEDEILLKSNGSRLITGKIEHIYLPEEIIDSEGMLDLNLIEDVVVSGLNTYHSVVEDRKFPYARP